MKSDARKWWLLLGGFVAFIVLFDLLENLLRTEPASSEQGSAPAEDARSPAPPELRRADDGAIEIRHDMFRRSTIRMGNGDDAQALFDCLAQGIEETFGDGTVGWSRRRVRRETQRIQDQCMGPLPGIPVPSLPPQPGN